MEYKAPPSCREAVFIGMVRYRCEQAGEHQVHLCYHDGARITWTDAVGDSVTLPPSYRFRGSATL